MVADGKQLSTMQSPFLLDGPVAERELFSKWQTAEKKTCQENDDLLLMEEILHTWDV